MQWNRGAIHEAIATAKAKKKIFLVYVEGTDDASKKMTEVLNSPNVVEALGDDCIPVKLEANSVQYRQFHQIYPILIVPSTFFIGTNGIPLEVAAGALDQNEFISKIQKAKMSHQQFITGNTDSATPSQTSNIGIESRDETPKEAEKPKMENSLSTANEQPSTSSAEPQLPLDERIERAKQLLAEKKEQRMKEEQESEKKKEQEFRKTGKDMQRAKAMREQKEMEEWAKSCKKEKEEERLARERVRQQIAQDRAERAARSALTNVESTKTQEQSPKASLGSSGFQGSKIRIQLRLPDGSSATQEFPVDATLGDVHRFVVQDVRPGFSRFSLATTFPRRLFQPQDYVQSLVSLGLSPSAVLLLMPEKSIVRSGPQGLGLWSILTTVFSPVLALWSYVSSFFTRRGTNVGGATQTASNRNEPRASGSTPGPSEQNARRRTNVPYRREGNVHRFSNNGNDADDDNNTWNGNSTQQL